MTSTVLSVLSIGSLAVILAISIAMVLSCYDAGFFGTLSLGFMALAAWVVLLDFEQYELSRSTVLIELAFAVFLSRCFGNFLLYRRRRAREARQVIGWPIGRIH